MGEGVDEKGQKEYLIGRTMDCSTGEGESKEGKSRDKNNYGEVNNSGIIKIF
jgi:hypothetical protein